MAKKTLATKPLSLEEMDGKLKNAHILQGNLEVIVEIQDRFQNSWGILHATAQQWEEFKKPYVEKKV